MEESVKHKVGSRKKIVALAIFLILLGFIVGIFTFFYPGVTANAPAPGLARSTMPKMIPIRPLMTRAHS